MQRSNLPNSRIGRDAAGLRALLQSRNAALAANPPPAPTEAPEHNDEGPRVHQLPQEAPAARDGQSTQDRGPAWAAQHAQAVPIVVGDGQGEESPDAAVNRRFISRRTTARIEFNRDYADLHIVENRTEKKWFRLENTYATLRRTAMNGAEVGYWTLMVNVAEALRRLQLEKAESLIWLAEIALRTWELQTIEKTREESWGLLGEDTRAKIHNDLELDAFDMRNEWLEDEQRAVTEARQSEALKPRYKYSTRTPKLATIIKPGRRLLASSQPYMKRHHAKYCAYVRHRLIMRMKGRDREEANVRTVPLSFPQLPALVGTGYIRAFRPRPGAYLRAREIPDIAQSRHEAQSIFGSEPRTISRAKVDRMAAIVRYSSGKKRDLEREARRIRDLAEGLRGAFEEFDFPDPADNVLIVGRHTMSSAVPALWYREEAEILVSERGFTFGNWRNRHTLDGRVGQHAIAEAFTGHISGHSEICLELSLNGAYFLIGADAMGSDWNRILIYVNDIQNEMGRGFDLFFQIEENSTSLCPREFEGYLYGIIRSEDLIAYEGGGRDFLAEDVVEAIEEWKGILKDIRHRNALQVRINATTAPRNRSPRGNKRPRSG